MVKLALRLLLLIIFYFAYQLIFILATTSLIADKVTATAVALLLSNLAMIAHLFATKAVAVQSLTPKKLGAKAMTLCLVALLSAMFFLNVFNEWLDLPLQNEELLLAMSGNVWGIVSMVVFAPLVEELLFRGALIGLMQTHGINPWVAIVTSALVFGIVHMNPAQIPYAFMVGILLGWIYYRTQSLLPAIVCHIINNGIAVTMMQCCEEESLTALFDNTATLIASTIGAIILFGITIRLAHKQLA